MNKQSESLKSKLEHLRRGFFAELPGRLQEIDKDFENLKLQPEDQGLHRELHRKVHNIKGTAASFGLQSLSQVAIQTESLLKNYQDKKTAPGQSLFSSLSRLIDELRLEVEQATQVNSTSEPIFQNIDLNTSSVQPGNHIKGQLIYICDDDPLLLQNLQVQLACFAYTIETFMEPKQMLEAIQLNPPDVIIMDIEFPNGEQVSNDCIGRLQQVQGQGRKIPIIFISARDDFQARLYAVQTGGTAYFTKPFKVMELVESLDGILAPYQPEPHRILIIDDDSKMAELHRLILQEAGMTVRVIHSVKTVLEVINDFKPDLILVDMYMPLCNGRELAKLIRQVPDFLSMPIVYLSSETDAKEQFSALRVGADGFLTKPIKPERLISEVLLRTERMDAIRSLMVRDSLTGLLNHTTILNLLETSISGTKRRNETLCFAMLDVDYFKQVNDGHGHAIGDQVLLALSRILKQRLRKSDFVGRYGGEEFAVILPNVDLDRAKAIIDELRIAFQQVTFNTPQGEFSCTLSGGVACYPEFPTMQDLVNHADKALYIAKNEGRNRIEKIHAGQ